MIIDHSFVIRQYKDGSSTPCIAKQFGVHPSTIRKIIRKHSAQKGIPNYTLVLEPNKTQILKLYRQGNSFAEIGKEYGCLARSVALFVRKYTNEQPRRKSKNPIPSEDIEKVRILHHEQNMTMREIGKLYSCTFPCVGDFFDKHNIPRRTKSEAIRLKNHEEANIIRKLQNSFRCKNIVLPSGRVVKVRGYEDTFLKFVFDNSLLKEEDICFNPEIIPYTQNGKERKYVPDFFVPKLNAIIEIKSTWILKKQGEDTTQCKQKAVEEKGYTFCLVLDNDFSTFLSLLNH